jgi:2-oxoglutarate-Fe(II)-dependent oxygenase superfamily protein
MLKNNNMSFMHAVPCNKDKVIMDDRMTETSLIKLFYGEVLAIRIKNYYPLDLCEYATKSFLKNKIEHYENAPSIGRRGMAFYETRNIPERVEQYYKIALENIESIRSLFCPYFSPLDKMRLDLQENWLAGANIENIHNRKMFVGLCRLLEPNVDFLPHQDIFHLDSPSNFRAYSLKGQFSANIYLDIADNDGGELNLWTFGYDDKIYPEMLSTGSYGMNRERLPKPSLSIKPDRGELVLFNARNIHAVSPSKSMRISASSFIGYYGEEQPLTYWS